MLKRRAIKTAAYAVAYGVAFSAGAISIAMKHLDNFLHKQGEPADKQ
ncbi:hypothetical protein [Parendozoicomonas sp. Alg238-R29]|nr:hypothetical protein [Parendozoicomonas sp. Alg238-R29]